MGEAASHHLSFSSLPVFTHPPFLVLGLKHIAGFTFMFLITLQLASAQREAVIR